jgi:hypothetical protein
MPQFVEWDSLDVRVSGEKLNALLRELRVDRLERIALHFSGGLLRIEGSIRAVFSVPFCVEVNEMIASGTTVRVPVRSAWAFGGIPIPRFLFTLAKSRLPKDLMRYEEPSTFVVSLDRFLPSFVTADVRKIWIIDGGLAVSLGSGGADLPQSVGGSHGTGSTRSANDAGS